MHLSQVSLLRVAADRLAHRCCTLRGCTHIEAVFWVRSWMKFCSGGTPAREKRAVRELGCVIFDVAP